MVDICNCVCSFEEFVDKCTWNRPARINTWKFNAPIIFTCWHMIKTVGNHHVLHEILQLTYSQLSLIRIRIIRTFTNSNEIPRSPRNFLTNSHGKTCIIRTSIIRTFTNPNTFCWSPQRRILVVIVHWFFVIHVLMYLNIFLSRYNNFTRDL